MGLSSVCTPYRGGEACVKHCCWWLPEIFILVGERCKADECGGGVRALEYFWKCGGVANCKKWDSTGVPAW